MRKKYFVFILLAAAMVLTLFGCNSPNGGEDASQTETPKASAQPTKEPKGHKPVQNGAVQIEVDNTTTFQSIEGFGAGYTYYSNYAYFAKYKEEIYDLLFKDAHLSVLRFKNCYKYDEDGNFDLKVEKEFYDKAVEKLADIGVTPKVLLSSWSPAAYLKTSESLYGIGTIAKDKEGNFRYKDYGDYWYETVDAYNKSGVPIGYLSIQNEPDYTAAYESCTLDFTETAESASYPEAFAATYDAVSKLDNPPKLIGPETMSCETGTLSLYIDEILKLRPGSLYGIAHHLYLGGDEDSEHFADTFNKHFRSTALEYPDLPKWQTEYYIGDFMSTAQIIQNAMTVGNLNCYIFWGGVWKGPVGKDKENLIGVDSGSKESEFDHEHGYVIGEKYYSMRHFSEYILPGYIRVGADVVPDGDKTTGLTCSAYVSPDNQDKLVLVTINDSDEAKKLQYQFADYNLETSKAIVTDYSKKDDTEEFYQEKGSLDENQCFDIPAHSVMTIVISGNSQAETVSAIANNKL